MRWTCIHEREPRTFVLVFDTGDEAAEGLLAFAKEQGVEAAHFTAIGAFSDVTLGFFDLERKDYRRIPLREQVEVLSLVGNVALHEDRPKVHAHVVVGTAEGAARGGHLLEAHVRPTLEVVLVESTAHLRRRIDEATGLALIDVEVSATGKAR